MTNTAKKILQYEWIQFSRNWFQISILGVAFLFGLYSIYYGKSKIDVQSQVIEKVREIEQNEFDEYKSSFNIPDDTKSSLQQFEVASDPAFAWHRQGYHAILPPENYSSLAVGQRDILPYYYRLTGMSLYYQLFQNEIANPLKLFVGNLDLAFVLVYLFPLLIIAFVYGLYSSEKESGTLNLLLIQDVRLYKIFFYLIINAVGFSLSIIGFIVDFGFQLSSQTLLFGFLWLIAFAVYSGFWFALLFLIVSLKKNSSFNAMTGAGCWLIFLVILPSIINTVSIQTFPINNTELAGLTRRISLEDETDEHEAKEVITEYLAHYPAYKNADSLDFNEDLFAKAYAALNSLKDINSKQLVDSYYMQIGNRTDWGAQYNWVNPSVNFYDVLTKIAYSDTDTFLSFQNDVENFHKKITQFYFEKLFWNEPITIQDYDKAPQFSPTINIELQTRNVLYGIFQIFIVGIVIFAAALFTIKRTYS